MLLNTMPARKSATALYTSHGFPPTEPYRFTPIEGTSSLKLDLKPAFERMASSPVSSPAKRRHKDRRRAPILRENNRRSISPFASDFSTLRVRNLVVLCLPQFDGYGRAAAGEGLRSDHKASGCIRCTHVRSRGSSGEHAAAASR